MLDETCQMCQAHIMMTRTLRPATSNLLRELGFVQMQKKSLNYYCAEHNWLLVLGEVITSKPVEVGDDDIEDSLRRAGFPVDAVLRGRRLRALLA